MPKSDVLLSPRHKLLKAKVANLPALPKKNREVLGQGDQCIVLKNSDTTALLVTRRHTANNFELLDTTVTMPKEDLPFHIPKLVAIDCNLQDLIDPNCSAKKAKLFKKNFKLYGILSHENAIFELPLYDGTLEDLKQTYFKKTDIARLESKLNAALNLLHAHKLTHNDVSSKNVFYTKEPQLNFYLGDFGSLTKNTSNTHPTKKHRDISAINRIVRKVKDDVEHKKKAKIKISRNMKKLPSLMQSKLKKLGMSHFISVTKTPILPQFSKPKLRSHIHTMVNTEIKTPLSPKPKQTTSIEIRTPFSPQPKQVNNVEMVTPLSPQPKQNIPKNPTLKRRIKF